jgi:adenylate cyclase, class 2
MMKTPDYQETEVKLYVPDLTAVATRLQALGGVCSAPRVFERNWRYDDPNRRLTGSGQVLRLRQDNHAHLTYKERGAPTADGIISRPEIEVTVSDFDAMHHILLRLGYEVYWTYEKYRTTYHLDHTEVVLDEMPYGNFVEIEGEHSHIEALIARLDLGTVPRIHASYTGLFDRMKAELHLPFRDLTFDNFKAVVIPATFFYEVK